MCSMPFDDEADCLHPALIGVSLAVIWSALSANVAYTASSWLLLKFSSGQCSPCAVVKPLNWTSSPLSAVEAVDFFIYLFICRVLAKLFFRSRRVAYSTLLICWLCYARPTTSVLTFSLTKLQCSSLYPSGSAVGHQRELKSPTRAFCVHLKCHSQSVTQNWTSSFWFRVANGLFLFLFPAPNQNQKS